MESRPGSKRINVVKVRQSDGSAGSIITPTSKTSFEPMPQLYLELLENKDKIRQNLVNQEYEPDEEMSDISYFKDADAPFAQRPQSSSMPSGIASRTIHEDDDETVTQDGSDSSNGSGKKENNRFQRDDNDEDDAFSTGSSASSGATDASVPVPPLASADHLSSSRSGVQQQQPPQPQARRQETNLDNNNSDLDDEDYLSEEFSDGSEMSASVPMPPRQQQPLNANGNTAAPYLHGNQPQPQPQASVPEAYENMLASKETPVAPRLADLKKTGEYIDSAQTKGHIPDLHRIYSRSEEEEEEIKREILFKFEILKKSYHTLEIPNYTIHTDLKTLTRAYENTLRRVSLDTNVDSYKQYLIGGFMLVEFVSSTWLSLDMQGFTQQQILNMNQYERLLIELGEKSYVPGGKAWPVEIRLMGMILMNAFIFIISKIIMKKTGNNLINMMNAFGKSPVASRAPTASDQFAKSSTNSVPGSGGGEGATTAAASQQPFRRRMRGPSINPDDIPDLAAGSVMSSA